jgi:hypothetical protein
MRFLNCTKFAHRRPPLYKSVYGDLEVFDVQSPDRGGVRLRALLGLFVQLGTNEDALLFGVLLGKTHPDGAPPQGELRGSPG